jgi:phage shock protein A
VSSKEAEQRIVELELELSRVREELSRQRAQYAAFYERSHAILEQMRELELRSAHLLQRKDGEDTAVLANQALSALRELGVRQLEESILRDFERYIETMLMSCNE